jgi:hypothetical protein
MVPAALKCGVCELTVTGAFVSNEFASLGEEELHFLRIFVHCEGRIREMESALGVSYPTIKNRLAKLKEVLAAGVESSQAAAAGDVVGFVGDEKGEIVAALEAGRISFEEAMERLKTLRASAGEES